MSKRIPFLHYVFREGRTEAFVSFRTMAQVTLAPMKIACRAVLRAPFYDIPPAVGTIMQLP